jgi:PAS domain S-box-containing protein
VFVVKSCRGLPNEYEWTYLRKDQTRVPVWLSVTALKNAKGEFTGFLGMAVDISARKKAEAELVEARGTAEAALHEVESQKAAMDLHAIVSATDLAGRILYANDNFCAISGFAREELIGKNHRIFNSGHHPASFCNEMWHTIARGKTWTGEVCNKAKDGSHYWVMATVVPFRDARGNVERYIAIRTDITDRKRREEEEIRLREAAEAATQAKSSFLATMSHEIRTPMNAVLGFTNLLLDTPLNDTQREYVQIIQNSGQNLLTVINDILDYSKIEAGKIDLESIPYDLELAAAESMELLAGRAEEKHVALALDYSVDAPRQVVGDPGRIRQVILNLVGNAIKFTGEGHVLVTVSPVAALAHRPEQSGVRVAITDTGIGIPKDKQAGLFNKFTQADSSTSRKYGGTGLGLAICKQLIELMDGQIGIESDPGKGSTFWFALPAAADESRLPATNEGNAPWKAARILIVDDIGVNRRVLECQLKNWGVESESVADANRALSTLRAAAAGGRPFHIALLDHFMPGMDGERLGTLIRSEPGLETLSLVMITSSAQRGESIRFLDAGFSAYVTKPLVRLSVLPRALDLAWADHEARSGGRRSADTGSTRGAPVVVSNPRPTTPVREAAERRVLVAEDTVVNQKLAKHLLERMGCRVDLAANGLEAVQMSAQFEYDLVLMDCHMPEMDGFEATRAIRRRESDGGGRARLPIVALTASAMKEDRDECLESGMDDVITKPFRPPEIEQALSRHCKDRRVLEP